MTTTTDEKLSKFDERCRKHLAEVITHQDFWREAMKRDIAVPWDAYYGTSHYANMAQYLDETDDEGNYPLDVEETKRQFARVVKWARENGWEITKTYKDDEFTIRVDGIPHIRYMHFYSTRQVVCKKIQTGTKHIEAHEEPIFEYQCDKVAFLNVDVD